MTNEHPEPIDLEAVNREIDQLRAVNDQLRAIHLRAKAREQRAADVERPQPVERDA